VRREFCDALARLAAREPRIVVLTGDLGYLALEGLRDTLGERFLNVGVAEQNMVSVAAGLASRGLEPWVYSIAPFTVLRPFEQIRNDVCLHRLGVRLVGNGGGYGYGIMGCTHHALEDVGAMRLLPGMRVLVPAFAADVGQAVERMHGLSGPAYLRLNTPAAGAQPGPFGDWRRVLRGSRAVIACLGAAVGSVLEVAAEFPEGTFTVFVAGELPWGELPRELVDAVEECGTLVTLEEHVGPGGLGEALGSALLGRVRRGVKFLPFSAARYPSNLYGSQRWHQEESGLAGEPLRERLAGALAPG